jgi:selenocysteine lyase/cysteine desulfurase
MSPVRPGDAGFDLGRSTRDASRLRREIARLFGAAPAERIVLAPGMLSALRHLFFALRVDRLLLTTDEYYGPRHFPAMSVETVPVPALVARIRKFRPGAVIASVVSWQGKPLPVAALFGEIRRALGARSPLLVADYTHAGAIGFPVASDLQADIVSGDPEKWLLPPRQRSRLAFLWMRSPRLFRTAQQTFAPFFLAVEDRAVPRSARWLDPEEVRTVAEWFSVARLTRRGLIDRHHANLRMKRTVARVLGVDPDGPASVLWTNRRMPESLERLERLGLVWRGRDGYTRILCRSEV